MQVVNVFHAPEYRREVFKHFPVLINGGALVHIVGEREEVQQSLNPTSELENAQSRQWLRVRMVAHENARAKTGIDGDEGCHLLTPIPNIGTGPSSPSV